MRGPVSDADAALADGGGDRSTPSHADSVPIPAGGSDGNVVNPAGTSPAPMTIKEAFPYLDHIRSNAAAAASMGPIFKRS